MTMKVQPRIALLALAVLAVLFLAGVSWQTLLLIAGGAYMVSMHLGGHGGGHGRGHGGGQGKPDQVPPPATRTPAR